MRRLLLVEDEAVIAMNEASILERYGYEVVTAYSGQQAVDTVDRDPEINLVLMDIDLGSGMDGTQAAEAILSSREIPIVFLTAHAEREMVERVKSITRYGYVLKSSGEFVLVEAVATAFELFEAHMRERRQIKRLETLVDAAAEIGNAMPIMLYVHSMEEARNTWANHRHVEFFRGLGVENSAEMTDNELFSYIHPDDLRALAAHGARLRDAEIGTEAEIVLRLRNGDGWTRIVNRSTVLERTPTGELRTIVGCVLTSTAPGVV